MVEYTGEFCTPRYDHCADADLDEQPDGLAIDLEFQEYYCETCEDGYYWDSELYVCGECSVDDCELCSEYNQCDQCEEGYIVQLD